MHIVALFIDAGDNSSMCDVFGNVFVFENVSKLESLDDWMNNQYGYVSYSDTSLTWHYYYLFNRAEMDYWMIHQTFWRMDMRKWWSLVKEH